MVLFNLMADKPMEAVPYEKDYKHMLNILTEGEVLAIKARLNEMIDGSEIQTAGWMPGKDWSGTPFEPIYQKVAGRNQELAARYFGLMVWAVFMERPEDWISEHFEKNGKPIGSRTYFRRKTV